MFAALLAFPIHFAHAQDITTGLVGHWKLNETTGTTATDSAGSNNGTMINGLNAANDSINGKINTALDFDGNDYVEIGPAVIGGQAEASACTWFFYTGNTPLTEREILIAKWQSGFHGWYLFLNDSSQTISFNASTLFGGAVTSTAGLIESRKWTHICATFKGGEYARLFVNGVQNVENTTITASVVHNQAGPTLRIGAQQFGNQFNGRLDDVRLYNRALSAQDVKALATSFPEPLPCNAAYEAVITYNYVENTPQYCNATDWINMGKNGTYKPNAVTFNGTNNYLNHTSALTGAVDSKTITGSLWIKRNGGLGGSYNLFHSANGPTKFRITFDTGDRLRILGNNSAGALILNYTSTSTITDTNWHHILFSIDLSNPANRHVYIDDAIETGTWGTYTDDLINLTGTVTNIGWNGASLFPGDMADIWFNYGTYIDLSVAGNRRIFIDASGNPVGLGTDGSWPTGSAPEIFFSGDTANWHTNKGAGGGFTENGTLITAANAPGTSYPGTCTSPAGITGEIDYNLAKGQMQYCNGANWIAIGPESVTGGTDPEDASPSAPTDGLAAHWKLDETSGTTVADSSGNSITASLNNMTLPADSTSGRIGTAFDFKGDTATTANVTIPPDPAIEGLDEFSLSFWMRPETTPNASPRIIGKNPFRTFIDSTGRITFQAGRWTTVNGNWQTDNSSFNFGEWVHVTITYNYASTANDPTIYFNGKSVNITETQTPTGTLAAEISGNITIGNEGGIRAFDGSIDDLRIYNRILSSNEASDLHKASSMKLHLKLDETSGTTATDSSPYANTSTMFGGLDAGTNSVTGQVNSALNFDGTDDRISTLTNASLNDSEQLTYAGWFYPTSLTTNRRLFENGVTILSTSTNNNMYLNFGRWSGGYAAWSTDPNSLTLNQWHHIAVTYDHASTANDPVIYINGAAVNLTETVTPSGTVTDTTDAALHIGNRSGSDRPWSGYIDDFRFYNRVLPDTEIADLYTGSGGSGPLPITGCPNIGDVCNDGSVYAGLSPDGNIKMHTTPADAPTTYSWDHGLGSSVDTAIVNCGGVGPSCDTGAANTALLAALSGSGAPAPYNAAEYCDNLSVHGQSDWYLPAQNELDLMYTNNVAIGGLDTSGTWYWSSTEWNQHTARSVRFNDGGAAGTSKSNLQAVRCTRKGLGSAGGTCSSPAGAAGTMIYNDDFNIMQYCNGSEWVGIQ